MVEANHFQAALPPADPAPAEDDVVIVMTDEEGNETEFSIVGELEIGGKRYAMLETEEPVDMDTPKMAILRYETDPADGLAQLVDIEDDEEFERVVIAAEAALEGLQYCAVCGCTDACGCDEGCEWAAPGLCGACVVKADHSLGQAGREVAQKLAAGWPLTYPQSIILAHVAGDKDYLAAAAAERVSRGDSWATVYGELARVRVGKEMADVPGDQVYPSAAMEQEWPSAITCAGAGCEFFDGGRCNHPVEKAVYLQPPGPCSFVRPVGGQKP